MQLPHLTLPYRMRCRLSVSTVLFPRHFQDSSYDLVVVQTAVHDAVPNLAAAKSVEELQYPKGFSNERRKVLPYL